MPDIQGQPGGAQQTPPAVTGPAPTQQPTQGPAGAPAGQGTGTDQWTQDFVIKHRGQERRIGSRDEAIALAQKGYDYSQRLESLGELNPFVNELVEDQNLRNQFYAVWEEMAQRMQGGGQQGGQPPYQAPYQQAPPGQFGPGQAPAQQWGPLPGQQQPQTQGGAVLTAQEAMLYQTGQLSPQQLETIIARQAGSIVDQRLRGFETAQQRQVVEQQENQMIYAELDGAVKKFPRASRAEVWYEAQQQLLQRGDAEPFEVIAQRNQERRLKEHEEWATADQAAKAQARRVAEPFGGGKPGAAPGKSPTLDDFEAAVRTIGT